MPSSHTRATYLGTATVLLEIGPLRLLTDPVFDSAGARYELGPVTLEKTAAPVIGLDQIGRIDAVLCSHDQHPDNLDHAARAWLPSAGKVITTELGAQRLSGNAVGLAPFESTTVERDGLAIAVTAMPAQHGPDGTEDMTGPVTGFLLEWPGSAGAIYISGDTVPFAGTAEIVARYRGKIAVAILHHGSVKLPMAGEARFSMSAEEAIHLSRQLEANQVVPVHYEGWAHFTEGRAEAQAVWAASPIQSRVLWLETGAPMDLYI